MRMLSGHGIRSPTFVGLFLLVAGISEKDASACMRFDHRSLLEILNMATEIVIARAEEPTDIPVILSDSDRGAEEFQEYLRIPARSAPDEFREVDRSWMSILLHRLGLKSHPYYILRLSVESTLRGDMKVGDRLLLFASDETFQPRQDRTLPYEDARPYTVACKVLTYRLGRSYLLFLRNGTPYYFDLAPTNEEVEGPDDPWVHWVKTVLRTPAGAPAEVP